MRTWLCRSFGSLDDLAFCDWPEPELRPGCVRIAMRAAALNFPDLLMPRGRYQVRPDLPFVPGIEGMGVVLEVAPEVRDLAAGDRVMTYAGMGCFAQQAVVPATLVHPVPAGMSDAQAAGFVLAYGTAWHGLVDRGRLQAGEEVLVLGAAGGISLPAIEIAKALDAQVSAVAGTPAKREACRRHGADAVIDGGLPDLRAGLREAGLDGGLDIVYDPVGGTATEAALRCLRRYGRLLVMGFASGEIPAPPANLLLLKQVAMAGVSFRQFAQDLPIQSGEAIAALARLWQDGHLSPHVHAEYPLEALPQAMRRLTDRDVIGKLVLRIE